MCKYKTHVYYSFSSRLSPLLGCRDSDWWHQFCYLMFNLLIVTFFEKCVFVLRTELIVWENGPISYIMLTIEKTAIQDSYLTLLLVFVIGIFLLISCNCFVWYGKKAFIHNESGASSRRIRSPNNYRMNLRHIRTGLDFSEDFWINREAVSDSRTNVKTIC